MQIYKPIINYIAAAGLALAVALTPQSGLAENPCETLETQLAQCQEEQRKKKLTPEEKCAETREIQTTECSAQYNLTIAGKAKFDPFGNVIEQSSEELKDDYERADSGYKICALKAELNEMRCLYSANKERNLEERVTKVPPKPKAKKKEPTFQQQIDAYEKCYSHCTEKANVNQCISDFMKQIAEYKREGNLSSQEKQQAWKVRKACQRERLKVKKDCMKEKKCGKNPNPRDLGLGFRGTPLINNLDLK